MSSYLYSIKNKPLIQINYYEITPTKTKITKIALTLRLGDKTKITITILTLKYVNAW